MLLGPLAYEWAVGGAGWASALSFTLWYECPLLLEDLALAPQKFTLFRSRDTTLALFLRQVFPGIFPQPPNVVALHVPLDEAPSGPPSPLSPCSRAL